MAEPIHIDFKHRRRIDPDAPRSLRAAACAVRMFLDREGVDYAVDVVFPDPRWDRRPYLLVTLAVADPDLEERIEKAFPRHDIDFALTDPEDLP